jgi:hypothetical protein
LNRDQSAATVDTAAVIAVKVNVSPVFTVRVTGEPTVPRIPEALNVVPSAAKMEKWEITAPLVPFQFVHEGSVAATVREAPEAAFHVRVGSTGSAGVSGVEEDHVSGSEDGSEGSLGRCSCDAECHRSSSLSVLGDAGVTSAMAKMAKGIAVAGSSVSGTVAPSTPVMTCTRW